MTEVKRKDGITAQFIQLLVGASAACAILFFLLQELLVQAVSYYFEHTDFREKATAGLLADLQDYVTKNNIAQGDMEAITTWVEDHDFILLELYYDHVLVYSSFAPDHGAQEADGEEPQRAPFYDWMPMATITFADGQMQAVLYSDVLRRYRQIGIVVLMVGCMALFLGIFLSGCQRIVRYICLLSQEIQAMEGGDLSQPVTIQGRDELTTLASCLDAMRDSLRQQQDEEAQSAARVKNFLTEMSHDLRTPLTTLLLYTEIVRYRRYQNDGELRNYLDKIDAKARQIKQLSDNLFEYALVTRDTEVSFDPPAPLSHIFEGPLSEMVDQLQQRGFVCALNLGNEDVRLAVCEQYVRRILDNITSNILKYADPQQNVSVTFARHAGQVGLAFRNAVLPRPDTSGSTKVGLLSVRTMMEKMGARVEIEQDEASFCITLLFRTVGEGPPAFSQNYHRP